MELAPMLARPAWMEWVISGAILLFFLLLSLISKFLAGRMLNLLTARSKTNIDDLLIRALTLPVSLAFIALGLWLAAVRLSELAPYIDRIRTGFVVIVIMLVTWAIARVVSALLRWYGTEIATRTKTNLDTKLMPVISRTANLVIYLIALTLILSELGINISPLIAGLGIGGLAVALALQPTLSNFLAGTYVLSDGLIRKGDYVELDSGQAGFVEEIGWRTTKIRHWQGNLIIMPNSRLSEAIVTDYELPEPSMLFLASSGVSYSSDLRKVERIALEVSEEIEKTCPDGVPDFRPVLRFTEFGDSNVNFIVVMKARNRVGQFLVKHEFIKSLHERFNKEGIEIQYPARKLYFSDGHVPVTLRPEDIVRQGNSPGGTGG